MAREILLDMKYIIEKANQVLTDLKYKNIKLDEIEDMLCDEGHSIVYSSMIMRIISRGLKDGNP